MEHPPFCGCIEEPEILFAAEMDGKEVSGEEKAPQLLTNCTGGQKYLNRQWRMIARHIIRRHPFRRPWYPCHTQRFAVATLSHIGFGPMFLNEDVDKAGA
jgi:hypothetical protein